MPSLKLNVHLFRDEIRSLSQVELRESKDGQLLLREFHPNPPLRFPARLWVVPARPKAPRWRQLLVQRFDVPENLIMNQWTGALVLLEVRDRVFAVAFGYGGNALPRDMMEPDFGRHVVGNCLLEDRIKAIETRSIDRNTRQAAIHVSSDSSIVQFEINTHIDSVQKLSGRSSDEVVGGRLDGGDTVKLNYKGELADLDKICERLLELLGRNDYKKRFPFLDHWRALKDSDPRRKRLDDALHALLGKRDTHMIALAHPDIPRDDMAFVRIYSGRREMTFEELNVANLYEFMRSFPSVDADRIRIDELNEDQERIGGDKLRSYLTAQVELDGDVFVLSCNRWFKIETDFAKEIQRRVRELEDLTTTFNLPNWERSRKKPQHAEEEGDYNERVASNRGYLLLDKQMFTFGRSSDKIEAADLLTVEQDFLCVKKMRDSATLSHLWAQASVSATLMNSDKSYGEKLQKVYARRFGKDFRPKHGRFVFAVATDKPGPLADSLFFFAKVNLLLHVDRIRSCGYEVALCRIEKPVNLRMPAAKTTPRRGSGAAPSVSP